VASADPGFRPEKLLVANISLQHNRYTTATAKAFFDALIARVRGAPGVQSVSYSRGTPVAGGVRSVATSMDKEGRIRQRYAEVSVDSAFFKTIGAQLVAGRFIGPEDRLGGQPVAVVSEDFVRVNLGGGLPLGQTIARKYTIVGVVKDMSETTLDGERYPPMFIAMAQFDAKDAPPPRTIRDMIVRTTGDPKQHESTIRETMQSLNPAEPPPTFTTMERALAEVVAPRRFTLVLLGAFAVLALGLALIGLFSVLAYLVAERTREIGIRMAMGADAGRVSRMILGHGLRMTIVGLLLGGAASIAVVRVLRAWMYEMSVYDAPTFVAVAALLCVVALVASWLPARRASRVDPVLALRAE